jgi:MFS family permease
MLVALRQRNFRLLWLASLISSVGTWALYTALPFFVYDQTGSALATGAMVMAQTIPRIALSSVAGVCVDRWDRKRTLIVADLARALLLVPLVAVHSRDWLWVIYAIACAEAAVSQFFGPARDALVPRLVAETHLPAANAMDAAAGPLIRLLAPALGGALLAVLGVTILILADVVSYIISAILILSICLLPRRTSLAGRDGRPKSSIVGSAWADWRSGVRAILAEPILSSLFVVGGIALIGYGMVTVLLVLFARDVLQGSALVFGWLVTAQGVGGLVGAGAYDRLVRWLSTDRVVGVGLVVSGGLYLLIANEPRIAIDVALVAIMGLPITCYWVGTRTLLQTHTPDAYRGRIFGTFETVNSLATLAGVGTASLGAGLLGIVPAFDVAAGFYLLAGAVALAFLTAAMLHRPMTARVE